MLTEQAERETGLPAASFFTLVWLLNEFGPGSNEVAVPGVLQGGEAWAEMISFGEGSVAQRGSESWGPQA
jgi:hypothetical protein